MAKLLRTTLCLALLSAGLSAAGHGDPASGPPRRVPGVQSWWLRNRPLLLDPSVLEAALPAGAGWLARAPGDVFGVLAGIAGPGQSGQEAILALGLDSRVAPLGHLEALAADRVSGRHLAGDVRGPVSRDLRVAAAVALGLSGRPEAWQSLRQLLDRGDLDDTVAAAAVIGLSFAGSPSDGIRFESCLRRDAAGPLLREAAAAALGRLAAHIPGSRRLLLHALRSDPGAGGRGAAVGLWHAAPDEGVEELVSLREAASHARDPITRVLALVTLSGRADPAVLELAEAALRSSGGEAGWGAISMSLLARSRADLRPRALHRLATLDDAGRVPEAVAASRALLADPGGRTRPVLRSSLQDLGGGNALFAGSPALSALLDLAARPLLR